MNEIVRCVCLFSCVSAETMLSSSVSTNSAQSCCFDSSLLLYHGAQCSSQRVRRDIKYDVDRYMTPSAKKHVDTMSMVLDSLSQRSVIDWHIANLEYANATTIDKLDAAQWDQVRTS